MEIKKKFSSGAMWIIIAGILIYVLVYFELLLTKKIFTHDAVMWYGSFYYFVDSIMRGEFPYWDPYMMTGTFFYPNISSHGLLDPTVFFLAIIGKLFSLSPLSLYIYFRIMRLFIYAVGSYLLFRYITKSSISAALAAVVLPLSIAGTYCRTDSVAHSIFLMPWAFYFLLLFFENIKNSRRYPYLILFALFTGIIMNVYIPAYYLFNLTFFLPVLFVFKVINFREVLNTFRDKRLIAFSLFTIILISMLTAPPIMVALRDASPDGELFPMLRIVQKNDGNFKRIMASEVSLSSLSPEFYEKRAIFSSYGNMVSMLYPDLLKSFTYWADHDAMAEVDQYIGIIPFLLCIIGLIYGKSRFRYVALTMMVLVFVNMFSFEGFYSKPYNSLQKLMNEIFPPLKMIDVREVFGGSFLFYMFMLLSIGFGIFFDKERLGNLVREKYRSIVVICGIVIFIKIFLSGYFGDKIVFTSRYDLLVIFEIIFFALFVYLHARGFISHRVFYLPIVIIILLDLYAYNKYFTDESYERNVLQKSDFHYNVVDLLHKEHYRDQFQYFREPLPAPPGIAFGDSVLKIKGAFSYGNNHAFFTTKRYYDFLTHIPPQNQLILNGVVFPVVDFFPLENTIMVKDKRELLHYLTTADEGHLSRSLFIEADRKGMKPSGLKGMRRLKDYEDVLWLRPYDQLSFIDGYIKMRGQAVEDIRRNLGNFLHTPEYSIEVREFSLNNITIAITNRIDGYLYYNDGWSRYWRAFDNGKEIPVRIANYNFKAVFLEKGEHIVRFVFDPVHYKFGLIAYYIGLFSSVGIIIFVYRMRFGKGKLEGGND
jgi:hypothetical protein